VDDLENENEKKREHGEVPQNGMTNMLRAPARAFKEDGRSGTFWFSLKILLKGVPMFRHTFPSERSSSINAM
jgi:hypothetical protein